MKKVLSLLVAAMLMLLPALSMAAETTDAAATAEMLTYTHADNLYTFQYPSNYRIIDRATIDQLLDTAANMGDTALSNALNSYKASIEQMDMTMLLSQDNLCNIIVSYGEAVTTYSVDQLLVLAPSIEAQIVASFETAEFSNHGEKLAVGENEYMLMEYSATAVGNQVEGGQCYVGAANKLYTIAITAPAGTLDNYVQDYAAVLTTLSITK